MMNTEVRDQFNSIFAAWTTYTPTWSAPTPPTLGNGSITGRYIKVGRTCTVSWLLTIGSTTTLGSGAYLYGLPFTAASSTVHYLGSARLVGTDVWHGQVSVSTGASSANFTFPASATNARSANQSASVPETLAAGTTVRGTVTYQTAT
nr:hypothetical protein [Streptomyces sp. SID3212]